MTMDEYKHELPEEDEQLYREVDSILAADDDQEELASSGATAVASLEEDRFSPLPASLQEHRRKRDEAYFAEDEELAAADDEVVFQDASAAAFQQMDGVVAVSLEGLYDEGTGKVFSSRHLKRNPPALILASGDGQEGEFLVTKEMAATLAKYFSDLNKAYNGVDPTVGSPLAAEGLRGRAYESLTWLKTHPLVIFLVVAVAVMLANALH